MRAANLAGRLALVVGDQAVDIEQASGGQFGPDAQGVYERWPAFTRWADEWFTSSSTGQQVGETPLDPSQVGPPSPHPRQIFAIGLNYSEHVVETRLPVPADLVVFTKFASCLTGPYTEVTLPRGGTTDWEAEIVIVIGRTAHQIRTEDAWSHVAGVTLGQDLSERTIQFAGDPAQFSIGKSFPGFGPFGPVLVTPDEFADLDDIAFGCSVNGVEVQRGSTSLLMYSIPAILATLSQTLTLLPGDVVFTGTPGGVGMGRDPQVFLQPGDELVSWADGIGELRQTFVGHPQGVS